MKLFAAALALSSALMAPAHGLSPDCDGDPPEYITKIDFYESTVDVNTLHEDGGELRYGNIGKFMEQDLDLKIVITGGDYTDIEQVWIDRKKGPSGVGDPNELNGKNEKFGKINLQTVKNKPKSGEAQLKFCFVQAGTDTEVTVEQFSFTTYDTDERGVNGNKIGIKEKLIVDTSQAAFFQLGTDEVDTELVLTCGNDPDPITGPNPHCPDNVLSTFTSTTKGPGSDNPTDPDNLTDKQISRSIMFTFKDTACWEFTYDHYCPADQDGWTGNRNDCAYYTGGNFLFAGASEQFGACPTEPPTVAPPTDEPTPEPTPTPPTDEPTPEPTPTPPTDEPTPSRPPQTTAPTPSIPGDCPQDIVVIDTDGVTEFPKRGAVKIISQDTSTVTVELYNAWTSEQEVIDSIFYNYRINQFDEKCYEKEFLIGNENYDTITIQCLHMEPYAKLDICVADGCTNSLSSEDNAEIPKCCHDDELPPDTQVVCYKLVIQCKTLCPEAEERRALRGVTAV